MSESQVDTDHPLKKEQGENSSILSKNDTMKVLTPFAFKIDQSLFGLSLATPSRRFFALSIDLVLVAMLSDAPGELLALFLAITFYKVSKTQFYAKEGEEQPNGKVRGRKRRALARYSAAFFLFIALYNVLPEIIDPFNNSHTTDNMVSGDGLLVDDVDLTAGETIIVAATTKAVISLIDSSDCMTLNCWEEALIPVIKPLKGINFKPGALEQIYGELAEYTVLTRKEKEALSQFLVNYHEQHLLPSSIRGETGTSDDSQKALESIESDANSTTEPASVAQSSEETTSNEKPRYSILKYIEALIQDLGLGFGWAAFYFTVFTAMWNGQTPGKKLLGIRVIQLDGSKLSLWESFGRYGGYGAGIATGMLGFIQIFWDSNRQAIHDKISATVVIDHQRGRQDYHDDHVQGGVTQQTKEITENVEK